VVVEAIEPQQDRVPVATRRRTRRDHAGRVRVRHLSRAIALLEGANRFSLSRPARITRLAPTDPRGAIDAGATWASEHMARILDVLLPSTPAAPATARDAVDGLPGLPQHSQVVLDLRLLVSELVTNSVLYAGLTAAQVVRVIVEVSPGTVRCEIHDPGPGFSLADPPARGKRDGGWGLQLVHRLTDRWGIEREPTTHVWFEIDLTKA
jgi:anti-sigma regulatory factor (Ser/Thr protein kinase)